MQFSAASNPAEFSVELDFARHRQALLAQSAKDAGWSSELQKYIQDPRADVTKDTDVLDWWSVHH
jgi:hypothetical protein